MICYAVKETCRRKDLVRKEWKREINQPRVIMFRAVNWNNADNKNNQHLITHVPTTPWFTSAILSIASNE